MQSQPTPAPPADAAVRIHWLGKKKIAADKNATAFTQLWDMPESVKLEAQTLDKLSGAPWRLLFGETNQASANLLRPLLGDLVEEETFVEVRKSTNSPDGDDEMILAIRLNDERAGLWRTNLAVVLQSLTHIAPEESSTTGRWFLKKHHAPNLIEFVRAGEWVVVGAAQDHNKLLGEILARIERDHAPFSASPTNFWLEVDIDPSRTSILRAHLPAAFPKISFNVTGDGKNVVTRGQVNFSEAVPFVSESWKVPTNFIAADLSSFTATRMGMQKLLSPMWKQFETNLPPNQLYVWSNDGIPMQTYFAAPFADASNAVSRLTDFVIAKSGTWFATNDMIRFQRAKNFNGLEWKGMPYIAPFIKSAEVSGQGFILGGFFPLTGTNQSAPQQLLQPLRDRANLVYYDWELTGSRLEQWTYITQLLRILMGKPELPPDSVAIKWLQAMSARLGPSSTEIICNNDREFSFTRTANVPFTAIELHLLLDWTESPKFPSAEAFPLLSHFREY